MNEFEKAASVIGEPPSLIIEDLKNKSEMIILGDINKKLFFLYMLSFWPLLELSSARFNKQPDKSQRKLNQIFIENINKLKSS
jgi:hypothetical protein